jgi:threonine dehydrogenase-like Zn-dependent dehydrogenase
MRAIRFDGARVVLDQRADPPIPGPGEAVIRPTRSVVSAYDALLASHRSDAVPVSPSGLLTLGHRFVGVIESLAEGVDKDLKKKWLGKRIVAAINIVCSRCDLCRAGLPSHCRARRVLGISGWDGAFAERLKLPLRNLVEVPREVDDDRAAFAEPLAAAIHAGQLVRIEGKPYVTVLGDSIDALLCAQVLAHLNASVRLLGTRPERFTLCEKWGVKHRHAAEVGRRNDQDVVVDCTGTPQGLQLALGLVRPRGKIVLRNELRPSGSESPLMPRGEPADLSPIIASEVELIGARCGSPADALPLLARNEVDVLPLMGKRVKLADGAAALTMGAGTMLEP